MDRLKEIDKAITGLLPCTYLETMLIEKNKILLTRLCPYYRGDAGAPAVAAAPAPPPEASQAENHGSQPAATETAASKGFTGPSRDL